MPSDESREFGLAGTVQWPGSVSQEPTSVPARELNEGYNAGSSLPPSRVAVDDEPPSDSDDEGYPAELCDDPNLCLRNGGLRLPPLLGLVADGTTRTDHQHAELPPVSAPDPEPQADHGAQGPIGEMGHHGVQHTGGHDAGQLHGSFVSGSGPVLQWMPLEIGPFTSAPSPRRAPPLRFKSFTCKHCDLVFPSFFEHNKHVKAKHKDVNLPSKGSSQKKRLPRCYPQYEGRRVIRVNADGTHVAEYLCAHCDQTFHARIPLKKHLKVDHRRG